MSGKKNQGHGGQPPAPLPDTPPAPLTPAAVAPDTVTAATPIGTLPADPFEPPLNVPPADPAAGAEAAREALEKLEEDRKQVEEDRVNLAKEREALEKAREQLEEDRKALLAGKPTPGEPDTSKLPPIVHVKALVGVIDQLRVQHRAAGEEFRLRLDVAEDYRKRGLVEILD